ncbi:putative Agenet-like domain-containing protein [Helianthus annuus]|nr:putative Agenet-like domain-containing protein [Helianthus annuus]
MANGFFSRNREGRKVEVSLERDVWFPATIVEDLGNNQFLVEYKDLQRVNIDHLHIRPSIPQVTSTSFGLLEKVDAFYDYGWWSGVITKKLADSRYVVYFKHTNKDKEFSHLDLRPHLEWKDDKWLTACQVPVSNVVVHDEVRETATCIETQACSVTRSAKRSKATSNDKLINPCKKSKSGIASPDPSLANGVPSKEVSNQSAGQTKRPLRVRKKAAGDLTPTTPNAVKAKDEDIETDGNISTPRKWGKTFRRKPTNRKSSLALNNQNGSNRRGAETLQQEKFNTRVKVSVDLQDTSKQIVIGTSDIIVEKSLNPVSENLPLSKSFPASLESAGKKPSGSVDIPLSITNGNDQRPSFEKRSSIWETSKSMEAFRIFPQNPHFRPLDNLNESARERHAIYKMVDFSSVFENMCHLRRDHPRSEIEDQLQTLLELETHGFDVDSLKNRLMEMLSCKDKREALETGSKDPEDHLDIERVKVQERNKDIVLIDSQINELRDRRERLVKENEESTLSIVAWEKEVEDIEKAKCECDRKFHEIATAPF